MEPVKIRAITHKSSHIKEKLINSKTTKTAQNIGVMYVLPQKIVVSIDVSFFSSELSNIHFSDPSSWTSFHHLNPTKILPETFLTNQKSNALKMTTIIKTNASDIPNSLNNIKEAIARHLNNKVNNTMTGLCACCKKLLKLTD